MQVCSIYSLICTFKLLRGRHAELTFLLSKKVQEDWKVQEEECPNLDQIGCPISHQPWPSTQKYHFHRKCLCIEGVCTRVHDHGTSSQPPVAAEDTCTFAKTPAKCIVLSAMFALNFECTRLLFGPQWWVVLLLLVLVKKASNHPSPCAMGIPIFADIVECHILWKVQVEKWEKCTRCALFQEMTGMPTVWILATINWWNARAIFDGAVWMDC